MATTRFRDRVLKSFGARLKQARLDSGFPDAKTAAEALGLKPATYRYWERGKSGPDIPTIVRICELFNVGPSTLIPTRTNDRVD